MVLIIAGHAMATLGVVFGYVALSAI